MILSFAKTRAAVVDAFLLCHSRASESAPRDAVAVPVRHGHRREVSKTSRLRIAGPSRSTQRPLSIQATCAGSLTAGAWFSSLSPPDKEFETDSFCTA
jgi:hypothetical protein